MKKWSILLFLAMAAIGMQAQKPWDKGGFETQQYRNLFVEMGYNPMAVERKMQEVFNDVFTGPNKVYFEVGDTLGYISDIKNHDVRTEGMSYGLMIAVQMDKKDIFDRLWRWSKKYMQHKDGPREGYFAWSLKTDGTRNAQGAASDGELYFITALIFASNRWGDDTGINYKAEAQHILNCTMPKEYEPEQRGGFGGFGGFGGQQQSGPQKMFLIDPETKLITFTPDGFGQRYTDPSYHIPAFYEVWARWADDGRSDYWMECARKSREFLHKAIDEKTGLNPDMCQYDGSEMQMPRFPGRPPGQGQAQAQGQQGQPQTPPRNGSSNFRYDSWRVPMNIALDYEWSCADKEWQRQYGERIQNFFYTQGVDSFVDQYRVDGSLPEGNEILQAGGFRKLRHSIGLVATTAAASMMCSHEKSKEFVKALWEAKHVPFEDGYFDAYYDGLLRLFAFMHLSGHYRVIFPKCYIQTGDVKMTIDPSEGGKILSYKYKGQEAISQMPMREAYGSTFWTSPQKEWNWPPVQEYDKGPYTMEQNGNTLVLTSDVSKKLGFRIRKSFTTDQKSEAITVTYTIINESGVEKQVAPWEITRVLNEGLIFFDAPAEQITPAGVIPFKTAFKAAWYTTDEANDNRKINADGKGWLAYLNKGLLMVKKFEDLNTNQPAPDEAEIQVYVNRGKTYIELESQGAYTKLAPGESLSWTVKWWLIPYNGEAAPSKQLLKTVRKLVK
ncbi:MAG: YidC/Oxa1 family insertase periplasmic-domain containing protein [Prevotella sp.]|nr:YidC/Oxa1 family insertase periplasmic-domain containing protein [Prevotella sp.]